MNKNNLINIAQLLSDRKAQEDKLAQTIENVAGPTLRETYVLQQWEANRQTAISAGNASRASVDSMTAKERMAYLRNLNS